MKSELQNQLENQDNKNYPLVWNKQVEGTPFTIIQQESDDGKYSTKIVMGNYVVKECQTIKECEEYIKADSWELRLTATTIYMQYINNIKKEEK